MRGGGGRARSAAKEHQQERRLPMRRVGGQPHLRFAGGSPGAGAALARSGYPRLRAAREGLPAGKGGRGEAEYMQIRAGRRRRGG